MIKRKDGFSGERALVVPHSIIEEMEKHPLMAPLHITDIRLLSQSGIPLPGAQGADNPIHPYIQRGRKRMVST